MTDGFARDSSTRDKQSPAPSIQDEAFSEFVARMTDEGASPEAAVRAADAHAASQARRMPPGELLHGPTARWWQHAMFVMLGAFLAVLVSVAFTAPAFHPSESEAESDVWGTVFMATFFPIVVLFFGSGIAMIRKQGREITRGYTTLRWVTLSNVEIRDSHGLVIPAGDHRLTGSAKFMHSFAAIAPAFAVISALMWVVRLVVS